MSSAMATADTESLISLLDPQRNYGRPLDDVVSDIRAGLILISPGYRLPVLKDARTGAVVKGTSAGVRSGGAVKISRSFVEEKFERNKHRIWEAVLKGALGNPEKGIAGDPRWGKLLFEYGMGKPVETGAGMNEAVMGLLARLAESQGTRRERVTEVYEVHSDR